MFAKALLQMSKNFKRHYMQQSNIIEVVPKSLSKDWITVKVTFTDPPTKDVTDLNA
jgi:hypothetical protein